MHPTREFFYSGRVSSEQFAYPKKTSYLCNTTPHFLLITSKFKSVNLILPFQMVEKISIISSQYRIESGMQWHTFMYFGSINIHTLFHTTTLAPYFGKKSEETHTSFLLFHQWYGLDNKWIDLYLDLYY